MEVDQLKDLIKLRFKGCSSRTISNEINVSESHVDRALAFLSYHGPLVLLTHPSLRDNSRPFTSVDYNLMAEYAIKNQLSYDRTSSLFMASRKIVTRYIQGRKLMDYPFSDQEPPFPPNVSLDRAYDPMHPNFNPELINVIEGTLIHEFGFTHEDLIPYIKPISARAQKRAEDAAKAAAAAAADAASAEAVAAESAASPSSDSSSSEPADVPTVDTAAAPAATSSEPVSYTLAIEATVDESVPADTEEASEIEADSETESADDDDFDLDTIPIFAAASAYPTDLVAAIEAAPEEPESVSADDEAEEQVAEPTKQAAASDTTEDAKEETKSAALEPVSMDGLKDFKLSEGKGQTTLFDLDM